MVFLWFSYGLNHQKTPLDHHPIKFWRPALGRLREWRSSFVAGPRPPTPGDHRCRSQTSNSGISRGVSWHIHIIYRSCYLQITCIYIYTECYIYVHCIYKSEKHYPITHHWLTISCGWRQAAYFKKAKASSSEPEEKPISIKKNLGIPVMNLMN